MLNDEDRKRIRKSYKSGNSLEFIAQVEGIHVAMVQTIVGAKNVIIKDPDTIEAVLQGIGFKDDIEMYAPHLRGPIRSLWDGAAVAGIDAPVYVRGRLARCLSLIMGGMGVGIASARSGLGSEALATLARAYPLVQELVEASIFVADMRALEGLNKAQRAGDVKANMAHLERQTGDFAPPAKSVNVGTVDLRAGWKGVSQVLDGEIVSETSK